MPITRLRRRLTLVGAAAVVTIIGCLGLAVRANAAAVPSSPRFDGVSPVSVEHSWQEPPAVTTGIVVTVAEARCEARDLTVLAPEHCE